MTLFSVCSLGGCTPPERDPETATRQAVDTIISTASALLGNPEDLAVGADGTLFVADGLNHQVHRFSALGEYLGSIGRNGGGPGEFRVPKQVVPGEDGFVVLDQRNARIQTFDATGRVTGTRRLPGFAARPAAVGVYGHVAVNTYGDDGSLVAVFDTAGERVLQVGVPAAPMPRETALGAARIAIARGDIPEFFSNIVFPYFDATGALWLVAPTDGRIERWSLSGLSELTYQLDEPEMSEIRERFHEEHRDPETRGVRVLQFIADIDPVENGVWILLNRGEDDPAVVLHVGRDGRRLGRRVFDNVPGAELLAVDPDRSRLYLAVPSTGQLVAVPIG